jgi:hypothetical protein
MTRTRWFPQPRRLWLPCARATRPYPPAASGSMTMSRLSAVALTRLG